MRYTWGRFFKDSEKAAEIVKEIRHSGYTGVYGVPRGGMSFAIRLSSLLDVPCLKEVQEGCLVCDDIIDSGNTRKKYERYDFIALHRNVENVLKEVLNHPYTFAVSDTNDWIIYPWEWEATKESGVLSQKKVKCFLCKKQYSRITNTHLWKEHNMSIEDYKEQFPKAHIDAPYLAYMRVSHLRGKSYEEIYGVEKGKNLKENRHERALEYYGEQCARCGSTEDLFVHHKDFLNIPTELGNHELDNLQVLCRSCYSKLHTQLSENNGRFVGIDSVEKGVHLIMKGLKDTFALDLTDINFKDTPKRVARAYYEIFSGIKNTDKQIEEILSTKFPSAGYNQMIVETGIKVYSMCPHHLLPVEYSIDIGYIPDTNGFALGVSKLARLAEVLAKRPVLQERLTQDLGRHLNRIDPRGVMIRIEGMHYCMRMRGIRTEGTVITSFVSGVMENEQSAREEFMLLAGLRRR